MDFLQNPLHMLSVVSVIVVLLVRVKDALHALSQTTNANLCVLEAENDFPEGDLHCSNVNDATQATIRHFHLFNTVALIDKDLGFWVKPRSTTWYTKFLMEEYDDTRWVQMFRMTKRALFALTQLLTPYVKKQNTNKLFAVGRSTVSMMLREVVHAINAVLRNQMTWPSNDTLLSIAARFTAISGLPGVVGAIDATHIAIKKPRHGPSDYYYFKSGAYTMTCQAVVDSDKRFLDMYVGMPSSTNDAHMLRRSTLFHRGQHRCLWDPQLHVDGFSPYLLGDAGYPLLPWLMVPHREIRTLPPPQKRFNRQLSRAPVAVENTFGQFKRTFRELLVKTDLDVAFVPDVVICCALLHNVLLQDSHEDVERLLEVLHDEPCHSLLPHPHTLNSDSPMNLADNLAVEDAAIKRQNLGQYLSIDRALHC